LLDHVVDLSQKKVPKEEKLTVLLQAAEATLASSSWR
jgi:hypothetical protein